MALTVPLLDLGTHISQRFLPMLLSTYSAGSCICRPDRHAQNSRLQKQASNSSWALSTDHCMAPYACRVDDTEKTSEPHRNHWRGARECEKSGLMHLRRYSFVLRIMPIRSTYWAALAGRDCVTLPPRYKYVKPRTWKSQQGTSSRQEQTRMERRW